MKSIHRSVLTIMIATPMLFIGACGYQGATSLPLPGAIGGSGTYQVGAVFDEATNLVLNETCRAGDVTVGSVRTVSVGPDLRAHVTCSIKDSVHLPANAIATLGQTGLLGERFVAFAPPRGTAPTGEMPAGSVIPASASRTDPDTEEVLGTLSMVLNGGSLGRLQTINTELNHALSGHEQNTRSLLDQLTTLTSTLNNNSTEITKALDALDHLTTTVSDQRATIGRALDAVPGGLDVLNRQRGDIVTLLDRVRRLSDVAVPVISDTKQDTVANLRSLDPILDKLAQNGRQIAPALSVLSAPIGANGRSVIKGDYLGLKSDLNIGLPSLLALLTPQAPSARGGPRDNGSRSPLGGITAPLRLPPPPTGSPSLAPLASLLTGSN